MSVKSIENVIDFETFIESDCLAVVHFWADWAAQCGPMNEVLEELAKDSELKTVKFAKVAAESLPEVSMKYKISAVPTFLLFRKATVVDRVDGASAADLTKKVKQQVAQVGQNLPPAESPEDILNARLKKLINAAPVILFMKGTSKEPKCGFSKTAIEILKNVNADYKTFDILSDQKVREGLKKYSDWPTYPQLYVNGELIGGVDIMKELAESKELASMLPIKQSLDERLKSLVNQHQLMIFMKGDRDAPKCGFSRQLMEIMKETGVDFETFDILQDEDVRQGLKTYSDWPTYPQIYVKGELVGGLDIIKELKQSGELSSALKGES